MRRLLLLPLLAIAACSASEPGSPQQPPAAVTPQTPVRLMTWGDLLGREPVSPTHAIQWGEGATDIADLWLPDGAGPHPVVLMVHGGCWQKEIADRTLMNWAAEDLRKRGLAVWNTEYRGVDEEKRVAAFGHSAGGHLALWLAARSRLSERSPLRMDDPLKLAGVVNSGGLADLAASRPVTQRSCLDDIFELLVGQSSPTRANVLSDTSPAELLPLRIPQVSVNGHDDRIAPPALGAGWARKARAAGDNARAEIVMDTGHVELITPGTKAWEIEAAALQEMLR